MQPPSDPSLEDLRSSDERISREAWVTAYPILRAAGLQVARARLAGSRHEQDREDLVATALAQFVRGLVEKKSPSFNQLSVWSDCLGMMRTLTRARVLDFLRQTYRNREDPSGDLPEYTVDSLADMATAGVEDIFVEIDRLDPPLPELFRERFLEGLTIDEIAARRGVNRNTLCTWFANALRTLRGRLSHPNSDRS